MNLFKKKFNTPTFCFILFSLLIALRDVGSSALLGEQKLHPLVMLKVFSITTTIVCGLILAKTKGLRELLKPIQENQVLVLKMGVSTTISFASMMYGIAVLGASLFTTVEHGLIPMFTVILAMYFLSESIKKQDFFGITLSLVGVQMILYPSLDKNEINLNQNVIGVICAIIASYSTALNSVYQKKLLKIGYDTFSILSWRFLIPSIFLIVFTKAYHVEPMINTMIIKSVILGIVGFSLPLVVLLFGLKNSTLIKFSVFNLLIPLETVLLASVLYPSDLKSFQNVFVIIGSLLILSGVVISENMIGLKVKK